MFLADQFSNCSPKNGPHLCGASHHLGREFFTRGQLAKEAIVAQAELAQILPSRLYNEHEQTIDV